VDEETCYRHGVELRLTCMRGGQSAANRAGWEAFTWELNEHGEPVRVTCPQGQTVVFAPGQKGVIARFDPEVCATCSLFNQQRRVQQHKMGSTLLGDLTK